MTTEERIQLLQSTPFFGATNEQSVALLLRLSQTIHIPAGDYFFHQNDKGDSLFLLEKGRAEIFKTFDGINYVLRTVTNGDCFGEMALIDFTPRSATVRAESDCTAIEISSAALHSLYQQDCEQFLIIQMNISREVSRRLRASDERWFRSQVENNCVLNG
ncbi:MAG: cyclic nucleotide-binding domain-containing protein [Oceanicoccus sp.]